MKAYKIYLRPILSTVVSDDPEHALDIARDKVAQLILETPDLMLIVEAENVTEEDFNPKTVH